MKQISSTLFIFILTSTLFSQEGYKNGFVLLTQKDTLFGFIENNTGYENSIKCNFQKNIGDSVIHFSPNDIYGYYFNDGKYYVSKEIENQRYFFEYLLEGKLNVYLQQDRDLSNHYFIDKDSLPFRELVFKSETYTDEDGLKRVSNTRTHNHLLSYYTSDYPQLKQAAMSIEKPSNSSLIKFAKEYHNATCVNEPCIIYEKTVKTVIEFEVTGGMNYIFKDTTSYITGKSFFTGNLMLNLMIPKISESIYFGIGLGYYRYPERIIIDKEYLLTNVWGDSIFDYTYGNEFRARIQIPFTVFYNNHRPGLSPIVGLSTNILYPFDFKAFCGINYQIKSLAVKLHGEYGRFPTVNSVAKYSGVRLSIGYMFK